MRGILLTSFLFILAAGYGQMESPDSLAQSDRKQEGHFFDRVWGPGSLCMLSGLTTLDSTKYGLQELIRRPLKDTFHTDIDDFILFAPTLMMYSADLFRLQAKHSAWDQTKLLVISDIFTLALVSGLKYGLRIERPDGSTSDSYPSGHTATGFVQAQVFYNEFRESHPVFAASGYLFAIGTGALRVMNNRHWVPDVLLGAGIAMLTTNIVYQLEPLKNWNPFKRKKEMKSEMLWRPVFGQNYFGCNFRIRL